MNHQGFTYTVELIKDGIAVDLESKHNLMPIEGLNHMLGVMLKSQAQVGTWYLGLFEGNYTPGPGDTAAAFPAAATECVSYVESTRQAFVPGAIAGGSVDNVASKAEFTSNADKTVYGAFLASAAAKGATSGVILSVARFSTPKNFESGSVLRVTAGFASSSS